MGGWWETISPKNLKLGVTSSYVSPSRGLNGLPDLPGTQKKGAIYPHAT
jgi:hypothetical protein